MKRILHTIITLFIFTFFINVPHLFAANYCLCEEGGGEWSNPATWNCSGIFDVPQPGDIITIANGIVTISSTVDLSTENDDTPTRITINGTLNFWPQPGCEISPNTCDVDLILDSGSEIIIPVGGIIKEEGSGDDKDIIIGNVPVLNANEMPFIGPNLLPENAPLPVKVVSFTGTAMERSNMLKWQTESEENTKEFKVERSATGREDFVEVGVIGANGFSEVLQNYSFEDEKPLLTNYYRLKMVDFDGSFEYSDIIVIEKSHVDLAGFEVFPIPIQDEVNVAINSEQKGSATLILTNYLGQVILTEQLDLNEGFNKFNFNWGNLTSNLHFIILETDHSRLAKKVF